MDRRKRKRKFKKVVYLGMAIRHLPQPVGFASTLAVEVFEPLMIAGRAAGLVAGMAFLLKLMSRSRCRGRRGRCRRRRGRLLPSSTVGCGAGTWMVAAGIAAKKKARWTIPTNARQASQ